MRALRLVAAASLPLLGGCAVSLVAAPVAGLSHYRFKGGDERSEADGGGLGVAGGAYLQPVFPVPLAIGGSSETRHQWAGGGRLLPSDFVELTDRYEGIAWTPGTELRAYLRYGHGRSRLPLLGEGGAHAMLDESHVTVALVRPWSKEVTLPEIHSVQPKATMRFLYGIEASYAEAYGKARGAGLGHEDVSVAERRFGIQLTCTWNLLPPFFPRGRGSFLDEPAAELDRWL